MKTRKYAPSLGTVSHGSLRSEDLLDAFHSEAKNRFPKQQTVKDVSAVYAALDLLGDNDDVNAAFFDSELASELVNELQDLLGTYLPDFWQFGTNEGDGSDFGYWICWDSFEESAQDGETVKVPDLADVMFARGKMPVRVKVPLNLPYVQYCNKDSTYHAPDCQYVAVVNDHGNVTLYSRTGKLLWDCV
jgi:hypothetical protein